MSKPGSRPRALAVVLAMVLLSAVRERLPWPAVAPEVAESLAGIDHGAGLRLYPVEEVGARAAAGARCSVSGSGRGPVAEGGELVIAHVCPHRVRPLPLAARRTLGLSSDLNLLSGADFQQLSGIGPALARRILQTRAELGGFESVEAVLRVRGIGPAKLRVLREAVNPPGFGASDVPAEDGGTTGAGR